MHTLKHVIYIDCAIICLLCTAIDNNILLVIDDIHHEWDMYIFHGIPLNTHRTYNVLSVIWNIFISYHTITLYVIYTVYSIEYIVCVRCCLLSYRTRYIFVIYLSLGHLLFTI